MTAKIPSEYPHLARRRRRRWLARTAGLSILFAGATFARTVEQPSAVLDAPVAGLSAGVGRTATADPSGASGAGITGDAASASDASGGTPAIAGGYGAGGSVAGDGAGSPSVAAASPAELARASNPCQVQPLEDRFHLDGYYRKECVVAGLPVVAAADVDDRALLSAARIIVGMLQARPDLVGEMADRAFRLGIIGVDARAVDLPEYRDLPSSYPDTDWDAARAYGATPRRPLAAAPEENLVCAIEDTYPGQSVLTHELGHSVLDMAVITNDAGFGNRVAKAYKSATSMDVYRNTYAMTNADEYWAEGVQDFFDASRPGYGPGGGGDGYDSPIYSRATLELYDPVLYELIAEVFTEVDFSPVCPS